MGMTEKSVVVTWMLDGRIDRWIDMLDKGQSVRLVTREFILTFKEWLAARVEDMSGVTPEVPEDRKVRPHRRIITGPFRRCTDRSRRPGHHAYVFKVPEGVAADDEAIERLRAQCDKDIQSTPPLNQWGFVSCKMVRYYICGRRLEVGEVGLLVPWRWYCRNRWDVLPCVFYIDRAQFGGQ